MKKLLLSTLLFSFVRFLESSYAAESFASLPKETQAKLLKGEVVPLSRRPGESTPADRKYVTMAKLFKATRPEIWEVITDKEDTEKFLDGVLESRQIERNDKEIIFEQRTKVGGPKGSYVYTMKYLLTPEVKAEFVYVKGEINDISGGWYILEGPNPNYKLVVYSLFIDPGGFAPQAVVKFGMKKTIPSTLTATEGEVNRRRAGAQ